MSKASLKERLKARAFDEATRFAVMALYLWIVFGVFALQQSIALTQRNVDNYFEYGFAVVNALIFAKVMLVAEDLNLGRGFGDMPLIVPIVYKGFVFSLIFLCFHILENIVVGAFQGKGPLESLPMIGGNFKATVAALLVFTFQLTPYFAYREIGRMIGEHKLYSIVFTRRTMPERKAET